MSEALNTVFTGLIALTVFLTALSFGLATSVRAMRTALRPSLLVVILANLILVPGAGMAILGLVPLSSDSEIGVFLCTICAAGPFALKATQLARGDQAWAFSLTVLLLLLNILSLPVWTALVFDRSVSVRPGDLFGVMVAVILLPVAIGVFLRKTRAGRSEDWSKPATSVSNVTLAAAIVVGVVGNLSQLADALTSRVLVVATLILVAAGLIGLALPSSPELRRASTLVTLNRATSVALLVVAQSFPDSSEVLTAAIVFGLVQTVVALGLALAWGRRAVVSVPAPAI
jgi:BASS family bile acid:Na+ symporter